MSKKTRKITTEGISDRKPWQRFDEGTKTRIVREVLSGTIGYRAACRKYKIARTGLNKWIQKATVDNLIAGEPANGQKALHSNMQEKASDKVLIQRIKALTKELERANLKIDSLETLIVVAEEDLKIKIKKKRGTKQSKECGKVIQK